MSTTDRYRALGWTLWTVTVLAALIGWIGWDRDPSALAPVVGWITAGPLIGELSAVGKRATFKREAVEADGP